MSLPLQELRETLKKTPAGDLTRVIVDAPFMYKSDMVLMGIGIVVLLIGNRKDKTLHRVSICNTDLANQTLTISLKKFEDIRIPFSCKENILIQAIDSHEPKMTNDWKYLFIPELSPEQARLNQAGGGIACSFAYPLYFGDDTGAMIFSYFKEPLEIGADERSFMREYAAIVSKRLAEEQNIVSTILT